MSSLVTESSPLTTLATKFLEAGFQNTIYGLRGIILVFELRSNFFIGGFASLIEVLSLTDASPLSI
jgi:hypothetical protein